MTRLVIKSRILGEQSFFMPDNGGYIRLESEGRSGTLGAQICEGGTFRGDTISASPTTFESECRKWHRTRLAKR